MVKIRLEEKRSSWIWWLVGFLILVALIWLIAEIVDNGTGKTVSVKERITPVAVSTEGEAFTVDTEESNRYSGFAT